VRCCGCIHLDGSLRQGTAIVTFVAHDSGVCCGSSDAAGCGVRFAQRRVLILCGCERATPVSLHVFCRMFFVTIHCRVNQDEYVSSAMSDFRQSAAVVFVEWMTDGYVLRRCVCLFTSAMSCVRLQICFPRPGVHAHVSRESRCTTGQRNHGHVSSDIDFMRGMIRYVFCFHLILPLCPWI
jgi:hypothetical protein